MLHPGLLAPPPRSVLTGHVPSHCNSERERESAGLCVCVWDSLAARDILLARGVGGVLLGNDSGVLLEMIGDIFPNNCYLSYSSIWNSNFNVEECDLPLYI